MGDGASPAFAVGDVILMTHDDGKTCSAKVVDTRTRDGVAEFKVHRSGFNKKDDKWLATAKMVRDTVDARREAGMLAEPEGESEGGPALAKDARAKKPKSKPAAKSKAKASEGQNAKASADSAAPAAETSKKKRSEAEPAAAGSAKRAKTANAERKPEPERLSPKTKAPKREPEEGAAKVPAAKKKKPEKKAKPAAASSRAPATAPAAAANGEDANTPATDSLEQEGAQIRVELSASLKRELIAGWERITLQGELVSLPRSVTAAEVLRRFEEDAKAKARSAEQAALAAACAAGLKAYFDGALRPSLLYAEERAQAEAALASGEGGNAKKEPSAVYGAEHLLRLFVKLPELMPTRDMDAAAAKAVQAKLTEVLRWMQRNASAHFGGEYVAAPGAAAEVGEKAGEAVAV